MQEERPTDEVDALEQSIAAPPLRKIVRALGIGPAHKANASTAPALEVAPATATTSELEREGELLNEQLSKARDALSEAERALVTAQDAFDASGADAELAALEAARVAQSRAREHVGRAERLCEAHKKRDAEAARTRLIAERDELIESVRQELVSAEEERLAGIEVDAIFALLGARAARLEHEQEIQRRRTKLAHIEQRLDPSREVRASTLFPHRAGPSKPVLARALIRRLKSAGIDSNDVRYRWADEVVGETWLLDAARSGIA